MHPRATLGLIAMISHEMIRSLLRLMVSTLQLVSAPRVWSYASARFVELRCFAKSAWDLFSRHFFFNWRGRWNFLWPDASQRAYLRESVIRFARDFGPNTPRAMQSVQRGS